MAQWSVICSKAAAKGKSYSVDCVSTTICMGGPLLRLCLPRIAGRYQGILSGNKCFYMPHVVLCSPGCP